jgi:CheY-like chemotaxis protein
MGLIHEALRRRGDGRPIPVIAITAKDLTEEDHRHERRGGQDLHSKGATTQSEEGAGNGCTLLAGKSDHEV